MSVYSSLFTVTVPSEMISLTAPTNAVPKMEPITAPTIAPVCPEEELELTEEADVDVASSVCATPRVSNDTVTPLGSTVYLGE